MGRAKGKVAIKQVERVEIDRSSGIKSYCRNNLKCIYLPFKHSKQFSLDSER
ncbi:MAG: hypothetical protein AB7E28_08040 [Desulfurella sp.]|jgi:hypothetical protein